MPLSRAIRNTVLLGRAALHAVASLARDAQSREQCLNVFAQPSHSAFDRNLAHFVPAHPLDRLRRAGMRVSINTDDPSLLGTNLPREYEIATASYGWSEGILREVARTSIEASFARPDIKERLRSKLTEWRIGSDAFDEMRR
jgi:Adenosine deaminase